MLEHAGIAVIPFDAEMATAAFEAFQRFGKGQGHPAQLNIIDCAAYALAKIRGEPLLFKGRISIRPISSPRFEQLLVSRSRLTAVRWTAERSGYDHGAQMSGLRPPKTHDALHE